MKKRWAFVGAACLLAALFLVGVLAVGRTTQWFGLEVLAKGASPAWEYSYSTIWDPEVNSVDALDIGWGSGPVEVRAGQGAVITVTEYASRPLEEVEQLVVSASGGALKIRWDGSIVPLGLLQAWEKRLVVEVPQSLASQLDELRCRNFSGDVAVSGFWAQDIQVASASGDVSIFYLDGETARCPLFPGTCAGKAATCPSCGWRALPVRWISPGWLPKCAAWKPLPARCATKGKGRNFLWKPCLPPCGRGCLPARKRPICAPPRGPSPFPCRRTMALRRSIPAFPASFLPSSPARKRIKRSAIKRGALSSLLPLPRGIYRSKSSETARGSKTKGALYVRRNFRGHRRFPV